MSTAADTTTDSPTDTVVRVEKGHADAEELAAVTAVLLARAAATQGHSAVPTPLRSAARWRRLERTPGFRAPHSWQR
ncbi:acyl-CoA carboxylase subunit epsilon [Streptomyces zagrosensis]|uniref:Acyl-CoA carboxylase subunit epsilon n=1 Tax=Streptomyces zagrosensis TaxID=1042984 RepID=A0A7W9UYR0_9ACTN|nr:acyl-CoA carboxylase subunit epsilon [Streptomyces zagrosensis]MBB5935942.1 hypothetical protein [Streptomyces zagrosensis]